MTRLCIQPTCQRAPVPTSAGGTVHAMCSSCEREALSNAWYDHAKAGVLRSSIVGGIPVSGPRRVLPPASRRAAHEAVTA